MEACVLLRSSNIGGTCHERAVFGIRPEDVKSKAWGGWGSRIQRGLQAGTDMCDVSLMAEALKVGKSGWNAIKRWWWSCMCADFGSEIIHLVPYAKTLVFKLSQSLMFESLVGNFLRRLFIFSFLYNKALTPCFLALPSPTFEADWKGSRYHLIWFNVHLQLFLLYFSFIFH